jgi:hypothetical protein
MPRGGRRPCTQGQPLAQQVRKRKEGVRCPNQLPPSDPLLGEAEQALRSFAAHNLTDREVHRRSRLRILQGDQIHTAAASPPVRVGTISISL